MSESPSLAPQPPGAVILSSFSTYSSTYLHRIYGLNSATMDDLCGVCLPTGVTFAVLRAEVVLLSFERADEAGIGSPFNSASCFFLFSCRNFSYAACYSCIFLAYSSLTDVSLWATLRRFPPSLFSFWIFSLWLFCSSSVFGFDISFSKAAASYSSAICCLMCRGALSKAIILAVLANSL